MHLYIATKGIKHEVDQFITQLQGKYMPFKFREKSTDPWQNVQLQLSVRPIQLWEIGYPKEQHDLVCATILGDAPFGIMGNDGKKGVVHNWAKKWVFMFRKMLHLDPIPKYKTDLKWPIRKEAVMVVGIGTKQDYTMDSGVEGI